MHRRRISVLTDLDLVEYYVRRGELDLALDAASVALANALEEQQADPGEGWDEIVAKCFTAKAAVLRARTG